jgi:hypothetical protein
MATFHVVGRLELTIMVNNLGTTLVLEQCLYAMFFLVRILGHIQRCFV